MIGSQFVLRQSNRRLHWALWAIVVVDLLAMIAVNALHEMGLALHP